MYLHLTSAATNYTIKVTNYTIKVTQIRPVMEPEIKLVTSNTKSSELEINKCTSNTNVIQNRKLINL